MKFYRYGVFAILGMLVMTVTGCKANSIEEQVTEIISSEASEIFNTAETFKIEETFITEPESEAISEVIAKLKKGTIPELDSYINIVNQYIDAINHNFYRDTLLGEANEWELIGTDINLELLYSLAWYDDYQVYYALEDIDGNGHPELFIGGSEGDDLPKIYDMYTNGIEQAINPFSESGYEFGHRTNLYLYSDGVVSVEWTNSGFNNGMEFYTISSDGFSLELVDGLSINGESYYHDTSDNIKITEDEFSSILSSYRNTGKAELQWMVINNSMFDMSANYNTNDYFFKEGITCVEYEGFVLPLSNEEIRQNIILNIEHLKTFAKGTLYALKLEPPEVADPFDQIAMGRDKLGYFYVTEENIYRMRLAYDKDFSDEYNIEIMNIIEQNENEFLANCDIVCSMEATSNMPDEDGWHRYIETDGERRIFRYYNGYDGGTSFYERIIWEPGQGITYYRSGSGAMVMHVEFGRDLSVEY